MLSDPMDEEVDPTVNLHGLMAWYRSQCDGEWEHRFGIRLETLDNPGWLLSVDLMDTDLQGRAMSELSEGCNPEGCAVSPRWIHCTVRGNQFRGACDPDQLPRLLEHFDDFRAGSHRSPETK